MIKNKDNRIKTIRDRITEEIDYLYERDVKWRNARAEVKIPSSENQIVKMLKQFKQQIIKTPDLELNKR